MKRTFDLLVALSAALTLLLPCLLIGLIIKMSSPGPVIFWSERMGRNGVPFSMPKFRTMLVATPLAPTHNLKHADQFVTPVGRILRKYSLDELPQFFSVIRGDMSIVGPRPVILSEVMLIERRRQAGIDSLAPGITGWAQINGRDDVGPEEKIELDKTYLNRQSMTLDLVIIWKTVFYVLRSKSISH